VLVLVQDRCTVSAKYTIGSEIMLNAPDVIRTRWGLMADLSMRDHGELDWWKRMMFMVRLQRSRDVAAWQPIHHLH
jgi:hypothetical protein